MKGVDDYEEGDVLVDWVLVAFAVNHNDEKGHSYPTLFSNGDLPKYRARGLLATALINLDNE